MHTDPAGTDAGIAHSPYDAWLKASLALLTCFPLMCQAAETCGQALETEAVTSPAGAEEKPPANQQQAAPAVPPNAASVARKAAIADGVSTSIAIASGAVELNPLVTPTPLGLVALTGVKFAVVKYAGRLPEREQRMLMKSSTALWGGAAANNVMVLLAAPPPLPVLAGLAMVYIGWKNMTRRYNEYDRAVASQAKPAPAVLLAGCDAVPAPGRELAAAR